MSVLANITAPSDPLCGNFNVSVTFVSPVEDFTAANITLTAVSGNGITGVAFSVMGSDMTYNLPFELPEGVTGSFRISITGTVRIAGESQPQSVDATARIVSYDSAICTVEFGTVQYGEGGIVVVPVTFGEDVIVESETVFSVTQVFGDALPGINYWLVGEDEDFELIFEIPSDRKGIFKVSADGYILRKSTGLWDDIDIDPILIGYQHIVPQIENLTIPVEIAPNIFQSLISFDKVAWGVWIRDFSYGVELDDTLNVEPVVLFQSLNFEVLSDLPVLVNEDALEEPNCLDDWERVTQWPWGVGRFFVLRFRRKSTDDRTPDLVLNSGSWGGYFDA